MGWKYAHSSTTSAVLAVTSDSALPITPATMVGRSASQMAVISAVMARSTPSSVTIFSPGFALRITTAGPRSFTRSNACSGWFSSNRT